MTESHESSVGGCPVTGEAPALRGDESRIDPDIFNNPHPFYAALREQEPVYYDPKLEMYLVTRYEDAVAILKDDETFSAALAFKDTYASGYRDEFDDILRREGGGVFDRTMKDPPEHTRLRRLMLQLFSGQHVRELEPRIRQIVIDLIEPLAERGYGDGIRDIGIPLTAQIICEQLGLDYDEVGPNTISSWSRATLAQMGRLQTHDEMVENARLLCDMQNLVIDTVKARVEEPRDDMISQLLSARIDDDENPKLSFDEVVSRTLAFLIAGNDTTAAALANLMLALATQPEAVEQLREASDDDRAMRRFVEETLRLHTPVHGLWRAPRRDVEIRGVTIPAGAQVCIMFAAANRDKDEFEHPDQMDLERSNVMGHLAFGSGIHRCVGAPLARMEIKVVAEEIVKRLDNIQLDIPIEEIAYQYSLATHTVERLPLTFTRRAVPA